MGCDISAVVPVEMCRDRARVAGSLLPIGNLEGVVFSFCIVPVVGRSTLKTVTAGLEPTNSCHLGH